MTPPTTPPGSAPSAGPSAGPLPGSRDDDARQIGELGGTLPALDVDTTTAELIAHRARASVGKPPPRRRWIVPILAGVAAAAYATWIILQALEVLT